MKRFKHKYSVLFSVIAVCALALNVVLFAGDEAQGVTVTSGSRILFSHPVFDENRKEVTSAGKTEKITYVSAIQSVESYWKVVVYTLSAYPIYFYFHTQREDAQELLDAVSEGMVIDISDCESSLWERIKLQEQRFGTLITERRRYFCSKTDWDTNKAGFDPKYPHVHILDPDEVRWQDFVTTAASEDPNNYREYIE